MKLAAEQKWAKRFMRKATIEDAIADYNAALDDAARAFQVIYDYSVHCSCHADVIQIATLINIHLAVGEAIPSKSKDTSEPSTATIREEGVEDASGLRSATLPPYVSGSMVAITDVQGLSTSPGPTRSATV